MDFDVKPVVLRGEYVVLEPLEAEHAANLFKIGQDVDDWAYMPRPCFKTVEDAADWITDYQDLLRQGEQVAFVLRQSDSNQLMGSTRFLAIRRAHRGLEIGWTWLGTAFQRTRANTEAKFLLLQHCFETLRALRVEFKTDARNIRSQKAIERIGATKEGVFRHHMLVQNDFVRDSVYYSIIDTEWPQVKEKLQSKLSV